MDIFFLYDSVLKYALEDNLSKFEPLQITTAIGCNSGEEINWKVSSHDTELEEIKIKDKKKIPGKKPKKGGWKDTWEGKPSKVSKTHYKGTPKDASATADHPGVFAWEVTYKTKNGKGEVTMDPGLWVPPPAPKDGFLDDNP